MSEQPTTMVIDRCPCGWRLPAGATIITSVDEGDPSPENIEIEVSLTCPECGRGFQLDGQSLHRRRRIDDGGNA